MFRICWARICWACSLMFRICWARICWACSLGGFGVPELLAQWVPTFPPTARAVATLVPGLLAAVRTLDDFDAPLVQPGLLRRRHTHLWHHVDGRCINHCRCLWRWQRHPCSRSHRPRSTTLWIRRAAHEWLHSHLIVPYHHRP